MGSASPLGLGLPSGWRPGSASWGVQQQQPGSPRPPTTCSLTQTHQRGGAPSLPGPAPLGAPFHLTPVPGPSGSAAAPLRPLSPGPPAPGAAGIPGVIVGRQRNSGHSLCPSLKISLPGGPAHQVASKAMPIGLPLGRPHHSPSALTKQTRALNRSHTLLEESWTQNPGQGPHRRMTNPGSTPEGCPSLGKAAELQEKEPWAGSTQASVQAPAYWL